MRVGAYSRRFRNEQTGGQIGGTKCLVVNLVGWVDFIELVDWEITG